MGFFDGLVKTFTEGPIGGLVKKIVPKIANAIPVVGPFISEAIPAVSSIFGESESSKPDTTEAAKIGSSADAQAVLLNDQVLKTSKDTQELLEKAFKEIQDVNKEISDVSGKLGTLKDDVADLKHTFQLAGVQEIGETVRMIIQYFKDYSDETKSNGFGKLLPDSSAHEIEEFVTDQISGPKSKTDFVDYHNKLREQVFKLQDRIIARAWIDGGQQYFELYILAVTWLLLFDKAALHLRAILAVTFKVAHQTGPYVRAIQSWNSEFVNMNDDLYKAVKFLGSFITECRKKREEAITKPEDKDKDIVDTWHEGGIGGTGNITDEAKKAQSVILNHSSLSEYKLVAMTIFDHYMGSAEKLVDDWRRSQFNWLSRLPPSPPVGEDLFTTAEVVTLTNAKYSEDKKAYVGTLTAESGTKNDVVGYDVNDTLQYFVTYESDRGEGYISKLHSVDLKTDELKDKGFVVRLSVKPVQTIKPDKDHLTFETPEKLLKTGKQTGITRKVYAFRTRAPNNDVEFYGLVGTIDPAISADKGDDTVWDYGTLAARV